MRVVASIAHVAALNQILLRSSPPFHGATHDIGNQKSCWRHRVNLARISSTEVRISS